MSREHRLVIAIDYGTTFTGVAFATPNTPNAKLHEIDIVKDWGPQMGNHDKIPSVISYSPASRAGEQQWGASISPDAVTMVNTKLELDVQDNKSDELDLILQVLDGVNNLNFDHVVASKGYPGYTWKAPEDIVTDYLTKVFQYLDEVVAHFGAELRAKIPVDIVLTVPVTWSYRAKNSTHRAVWNAGFNDRTFPNLRDIIMVTEPEAAAIYTARYLKEDKGQEFLKQGECFVLCDAGGGTVDVVSYKVTQLEPSLELEPVTLPTGAKCGSIYIDGNFKRWLREELGDRNYRELDPRNASQKISAHDTEGKEMRVVMKAFDAFKKKFVKTAREMKMDLPEPLDNLNIDGKVVGGELTITNEEMQSFFDPCVNRIVELIQGQIQQIERKRNRVRNIFLVGGFGESPYLQEELEFSMRLRRIQLWRPDTSWSAVVRGAVIFGIEKSDHKNLAVMKTCPRSYGLLLNHVYSGSKHDRRDYYTDSVTNRVMAKGQLTWLILRGDLLLSDARKEVEKEVAFSFRETDNRTYKLPIYEYPDDDIPDRFETSQEELNEVAVLNCDFSKFPIDEFDRFENPRNGRPYYRAHCICKAVLSDGILTVEIIWNEVQVCSVEIKDQPRVTKSRSQVSRPRSRAS